MTTLAIPTYFHNWIQEKSGDGSITIEDNGKATIAASAGSTAYLYTTAQLFPGESVRFSCNTYAASGEAQVSIMAFTPDSSKGDVNEFNALSGGKNNKPISVEYTAPPTSDECVLVYFKVGVETDKSGSVTVMCPRAVISTCYVGTTRTNAEALIELNGGSASINKSYLQTGIQEVNLVPSPDDPSTYLVEVVMDRIVATNGSGKSIYPSFSYNKWVSSSTTTNKLAVGVVSYNALSRRVYLGFYQPLTGALFDARAIYQCNINFKSEII